MAFTRLEPAPFLFVDVGRLFLEEGLEIIEQLGEYRGVPAIETTADRIDDRLDPHEQWAWPIARLVESNGGMGHAIDETTRRVLAVLEDLAVIE